jgi:L-asparaginase II
MSVPAALFELTRGHIVESTHYGDIAIVDSLGNLRAWYGDPYKVAFLRSSAKPFQVLPFVEYGGVEHFDLTQAELALACASHEGSDKHVRGIASIQAKAGIQESQLQCGVHNPGDVEAYKRLLKNDELPSQNRNNCSGKHSAMLAYARMLGVSLESYLEFDHPVQRNILTTFAEMCALQPDAVELGIDGCSAVTFAVPLYNVALAFARLCDPHDLPAERAQACQKIVAAMSSQPEMISGPTEFDCRLMQVGQGKIVCKRGAEGFQAIGVLPGANRPDSPGLGIAIKVLDGDLSQRRIDLEPYSRVRPAVTLEVLKQLELLDAVGARELEDFGPVKPLKNHRGLVIGESRPVFSLSSHA